MGLNGVILLAYILAIPANEIVIPTVLMLTTLMLGGSGSEAGVLMEGGASETFAILQSGGWTLMTGVCVMLFCLLHHPCSTRSILSTRRQGASAGRSSPLGYLSDLGSS